MKKTKRGVKQFFVMALTTMLVTESVFMPVSGKVNKGASAQTETVEQQISDNSVEDHGEESVSANFVLEQENKISENSVLAMNDGTSADQEAAEYSGTDGDLTWSIDADGLLTVTGKGDYDGRYPDWFPYGEDIKTAYVNVQEITNMGRFFYCCRNMTEVDFGDTDTSEVLSMEEMFLGCESLTFLDVSGFNTSSVRYMGKFFYGCEKLQILNVQHFDTANVLDMQYMFADCKSLTALNVSGFKTENVADMCCMFRGCSSLKNLNLSGFKTGNVTNMGSMFSYCSSLKTLNLSGFTTNKVTNMDNMFRQCTLLEEIDISAFNTEKVQYTSYMFYECSSLTELNLGDIDVSKVTNMSYMFAGCRSLEKLDVSKFDSMSATNMQGMFMNCSGLTELNAMGLNTLFVKNMSSMFQGCSNLSQLSLFGYTGDVTDMRDMFRGCCSLTYLDLSNFSVYDVTNMSNMFCDCSSLRGVRFYGYHSSNLENVSGMFSGCSSLEKIDLRNFDMSKVTNTQFMFDDCSSLTSVDISVFKGSDIYQCSGMFYGCTGLKELDLSDFGKGEIEYYDFMLKNCKNLISVHVGPTLLKQLIEKPSSFFEGCEIFSDIYFDGTGSEWETACPLWKKCVDSKIRYAAVHLSDGTIEQDIYHENETFHYIENGGFESQKPMSNSYTCDLSPLFDNSYNYHHDLAKVSIRAAMAAMSTEGGTNSGNIEEMMNNLNISNRVIHYPNPSYNSIGYAMGTRRIYHNNEKKTLIMVAIRGGGYGAEWGGNANVGSGMNHEGFDLAAKQVYVALNQYIGELKADEFTDGSDIVVWISGYSRGAATTNLLAAKLSDDNLASGVLAEYNVTEDHISAVKNINVHAFCFECPQNTTDANSNSLKYANIVNIINPKDFVTYVAMNNGWDWKFRRYGKDYVLPDEANMSGYATYRRRMELAYAGESVPEIEMGQSVHNKNVATMIANTFRRKSFPIIYEGAVQKIATSAMAEGKNIGDIIWENIMELHAVSIWKVGTNSGSIAVLASEFLCIKDNIASAHYPELCMAWMDSISEEVLKQKKSFWKVFVNCPVDIYVYQDENLVGLIKDDTPQEIENGIITMMDDNGQKVLVLPGDSKYKLLCKATDNGTMTITTSCYEQTENLPTSVVSYYELPLQTGAVYEVFTTTSNFALKDVSGNSIVPSVFQSGADVKMYRVALSVEGNGEVTGVNTYAIGEFAKVTAHPLENEKFLGWYEDGKLVGGEVEYRFCVKKDTNLVAKFTQNCCESKNNEKNASDEKVSIGSRYVIKNHTYEVTSVTKKTVTFVKTASKSKTITIPSYVAIDGTEYKVTAVAAKAMKGNKKVTKLNIGNNVTSIGASAFSGCKKLTKVTIGKGVTKIGKKAFYKCKKLKSVTIKTKKLKSIGKYAFKGIATKAQIKCPSKKYMKYKKMLVRSKIGKKVKIR